MFSGVKVFSATMANDRARLGEEITEWLARNESSVEVVDKVITQSSDAAFHCLSIIIFYTGEPTWNPPPPDKKDNRRR